MSLHGPKEAMPGKGEQGQRCNVTQCQEPDSAHHYNNVMHKWYCKPCAEKIEYWANKDGNSFFDGITGKRDY